MQPMSMSERSRTIEKSTAERSRFVLLRRAQSRTTHDLFTNFKRLACWRHRMHCVACCENPRADNPLATRPCRGLLSCRPSFLCGGQELFAELLRPDPARRPSGLLADRAEMRVSRRAFLWHEVSIEVAGERRDRATFEV
jgi:hypothetical protein